MICYRSSKKKSNTRALGEIPHLQMLVKNMTEMVLRTGLHIKITWRAFNIGNANEPTSTPIKSESLGLGSRQWYLQSPPDYPWCLCVWEPLTPGILQNSVLAVDTITEILIGCSTNLLYFCTRRYILKQVNLSTQQLLAVFQRRRCLSQKQHLLAEHLKLSF